ncbi:MAG: HK97 family phage prohead protease [Pseudomonadota bacterium]
MLTKQVLDASKIEVMPVAETKMLTTELEITQMDGKGIGLAVIADLSDVDHDGDGYMAGAFSWAGDQWVPLLVEHNRGMPFGKARIYEEGSKVLAELHLNLETDQGRNWHKALTFDLERGKPVQQWSFGYRALEAEKVFRGGRQGRVLHKVKAFEVSAVVVGAGRATRTLEMKQLKAALKEGEFKSLIEQLGTAAAVIQGDPDKLSETGLKQLTEIHGALGAVLQAKSAHAPEPESDPEGDAAMEHEIARMILRDAGRHLGNI